MTIPALSSWYLVRSAAVSPRVSGRLPQVDGAGLRVGLAPQFVQPARGDDHARAREAAGRDVHAWFCPIDDSLERNGQVQPCLHRLAASVHGETAASPGATLPTGR